MKIILIVLVCTVLFLFGMTELEYYRESNLIDLEIKKEQILGSTSSSSSISKEDDNSSSVIETLSITISGEVNNPGKYTIDYLDSIESLISKAGGLTLDADHDCINLYFLLNEDYDSIYIPKSNGNNKISINSADEATLDLLPGIGTALAAKIVSYRNECGEFQILEQIMLVSGIKTTLFDKIKDFIRL